MKRNLMHVGLCLAMLTSPAFAQTQRTQTHRSVPAIKARDVSLQSAGVVRGVALNTAAKPIANATVLIQYGPHVVARTKTNADGSFAIRGLRAGVHTVSVGSRSETFRFWTAAAAPPSALKTLAVNGDSGAVRGQQIPPIGAPIVCTAIVAGLVGGLIGYHANDDDDRRRSSSP